MRWELRFFLVGQLLMLLLAPLVGQLAYAVSPHDFVTAMYFIMVTVLWPMGPMIYMVIFRPHVI